MSTALRSTAPRAPTHHRAPLPVAGHPLSNADTLDRLVREQIRRIASTCEVLPSRAFTEALRGERRPLGCITIARALLAARTDGVPYDIVCGVAEVMHAWIRDIYGHELLSVAEAFGAETREQAEADVAQMLGLTSRSVASLDHAIEETTEAIGAQRAFLASLLRERAVVAAGRFA